MKTERETARKPGAARGGKSFETRLAACAAAAGGLASRAMTNPVPNIVFVLMDDLGWRDLGCQGSTFYETPRLDALAGEGMRFTDAYASCPVCSPTRASVMTGKYPATVGITQYIGGHNVGRLCDVPYFGCLPLSEVSLATALREGGYQTWHVGKWHLGGWPTLPEQHGFDVNIGGGHVGWPANGYFSPYKLPALKDGSEGEFLTDRLTDEAIALMRRRDPSKPFFLNLWHYAVHTPIQAPAALVEKYRRKAASLGLDPAAAIIEGEEMGFVNKDRGRVRRRVVQSDPAYAALVENLDTNIGRMLDALAELGLAENTLVVFTSDNGGLATAEGSPTCNAPLAEGKGWMYEGGTREPLLVRWPAKIAVGSTCATPVTTTDFYPTLLEAAGLPARPEQHCDGVSLMPLLADSGRFEREAIYWHYPHYSNQGGRPACSLRAGDWKLIRFFEDERMELYNLREDISEQHDRAATQPELAARLNALLTDWMRSVMAMVPRRNPHFGRG